MNAVITKEGFQNLIKIIPHPVLITSLLAVIISGLYSLSGIHSLNIFLGIAPLLSAGILFLEGLCLTGSMLRDLYLTKGYRGPAETWGVGIFIAIAIVCTLVIPLSHIWLPKTAAGIGAIFSLIIYGSFNPE